MTFCLTSVTSLQTLREKKGKRHWWRGQIVRQHLDEVNTLLVWRQRGVTSSVHWHAWQHTHPRSHANVHSSVWMIKMCLHLNFPSRRTHMGLRVMTKKIPLWILTKCCSHTEKTPMCRVLLADFIYHSNCGWSENLVGGKGLIDWANFAHSYLRIILVKLSIIAYNETLRSWVIYIYFLMSSHLAVEKHTTTDSTDMQYHTLSSRWMLQQRSLWSVCFLSILDPGKMQCSLNPRMLLGGHPETKTRNIWSHLYNNFLIISIKTYCRDIKVHSVILSLTIYKC